MSTNKLHSLLEKSIALTNVQLATSVPTMPANGGGEPLEQVEFNRPIDQLEQQSRRLWQQSMKTRAEFAPANAAMSDTKAQMLLAGRGFDSDRISQTLQQIHVAQAFEPMQALEDTDVDGFLRNEHELLLLGTIEEMRERCLQDHDAAFESAFHDDWEQQKRVVFESLSHSRLVGLSSTASQPSSAAFSSRQAALPAESLEKMQSYSRAVVALNDLRIQNKSAQVASLFGSCLPASASSADVKSAWFAIKCVLGEVGGSGAAVAVPEIVSPLQKQKLYPSSVPTGEKLEERCFAKQYAAPYDDPEHIVLRKRFLTGSRVFLESGFCDILNLKQPARMPTIQKVQMFLRDCMIQSGSSGSWEMVDGLPVWAAIFYLIRAGDKKAALEVAGRFEKYFVKTEPRFLEYLNAWVTGADHMVPKKLASQIAHDFQTKVRDGALRHAVSSRNEGGLLAQMAMAPVDPYKYLLYRILGRIILPNEDNLIPQAVASSMAGGRIGWEDQLWFQLMLARENIVVETAAFSTTSFESSMAGSAPDSSFKYGLREVYQTYVVSLPPKDWTSNGKYPYRYFMLLLLTGEFERAVQFLWSHNNEIDSLHIAIAFAYYGLLRIPKEIDSMESEIGSAENELVLIHVVQMLRLYLQRIFYRAAHPVEASHYTFLLCLFREDSTVGKAMQTICHQWIIDTALETGQIDEFFGSLSSELTSSSGYRRSGFLDKYLHLIGVHGWEDFKRMIIIPAAQKAERQASSAGASKYMAADNMWGAKRGNALTSEAEVGLQQNNAILLYNLAEDYNTVLEILGRRASAELSACDVQSAVEVAVSTLTRASSTVQSASYAASVELLKSTESTIQSTLQYYSSRVQISSRINADIRRNLLVLSGLASFFRAIMTVSSLFVEKYAAGSEYAPRFDVTTQGPATRFQAVADVEQEWRRGLQILDELSLVPIGISRLFKDGQMGSGDTSMMSFARQNSIAGTPYRQSVLGTPMNPRFSNTGGLGASFTGGSTLSASGRRSDEVDYTRITAKAENLRKEFSDLVLIHLPYVLLGSELLLLIGWFENKSIGADLENGKQEFGRMSRHLLAFASSVTRWFRIPSEVHQRLVAMDELMMHQ